MWKIALVYGAALIALSAYGYLGMEYPHWTSLIPSFFGVPIVACSLLARNPTKKKAMMHVIVLLALLGFFGSAPGLVKLVALLQGEPVIRTPLAIYSQSIMAVLSLGFIILAVKSFIDARKSRALEA